MEKITNLNISVSKYKINSFTEVKSLLEDLISDNKNIFNFIKNTEQVVDSSYIKNIFNDFLNVFDILWKYDKHLSIYHSKIIEIILTNHKEIIKLLKQEKFDKDIFLEYFNNIHLVLRWLLEIVKEFIYEEEFMNDISEKNFEIQSFSYFDKNWAKLWIEHSIWIIREQTWEMIKKEKNSFINKITNQKRCNLENFDNVNTLEKNKLEKILDYISKNNNSDNIFSVPLNPIYFQKYQLPIILKDYFDKWKIKYSSLNLEIDDVSFFEDYNIINSNIEKLREVWFKILVKNYPFNNNSLKNISLLKWFDKIKIDINKIFALYDLENNYEHKNWIDFIKNNINIESVSLKEITGESTLESFILSLKFLKILYPEIELFWIEIDNEKQKDFIESIGLFSNSQGYFYWRPFMVQTLNKKNVIQNKIKNWLDLFKQDSKESLPIKELIKELYWIINYEEIFNDSFSEDTIYIFVKFLEKLEFDCVSLYTKYDNMIYWKKVSLNGNIENTEFSFNENDERIEKENVNIRSLILGKEDFELEWFKISNKGISEEWDDLVIQIYDNVYIWFDNTKIAISNLSPLQWFSTLFLAKILKLNIDKYYKKL